MAMVFVAKLGSWLEAKFIPMSIELKWNDMKPGEISDKFYSYFHKTFMNVLANDYWIDAAKFLEDHRKVYRSEPYVSPPTQWLWNAGKSITSNLKDEALEQVRQHNDWFTKHLVSGNDSIMDKYPNFVLTGKEAFAVKT
ncbi:hypothetical protein FQN54_009099 [Arachnomyces sp. PD_36]|nr:hypothetical protein FQN54_009099 [Arachnomyces sp. PD_36]